MTRAAWRRIRRAFRLLLLVAPLPWGASGAQEIPPPTRVTRVDLTRYVGLWHEIARLPNRFQRACAWGVTAEYSLRPDGRIDVVNRCHEKDGRFSEAKGLARVEDRESNSALEVSFFSILGWRPVWGDYWIIDLADDYSHAVVCSPDRKYGWILARESGLPSEVLDGIFAKLRMQGFEPGAFQATAPAPPG